MRQTWNHGSVGMGDEAIERGGRRHAGRETTSNNLEREKKFNSWLSVRLSWKFAFQKLRFGGVVTKNFMFVMLEGTRNWESMVGWFILNTENSRLGPGLAKLLTLSPAGPAGARPARGSQLSLDSLTVNMRKKLDSDIIMHHCTRDIFRTCDHCIRVTGPALFEHGKFRSRVRDQPKQIKMANKNLIGSCWK